MSSAETDARVQSQQGQVEDDSVGGNGKLCLNITYYYTPRFYPSIRLCLILEMKSVTFPYFPAQQIHPSSTNSGGGNRDVDQASSRGKTRGSLMSLKSQDSIGTSSSICGDNISITSSTRRTSGSLTSTARRINQQLGGTSHGHVASSSANPATAKVSGASSSKRSSLSSVQSQGEYIEA